jgi:hypothetical protein
MLGIENAVVGFHTGRPFHLATCIGRIGTARAAFS